MKAGLLLRLEGLRVFVAGHRGMVGSAIVRRLGTEKCLILTVDRRKLDLTRQEAVEQYIRDNAPDVVIIAAARVGGIFANNNFPVDFISDNLAIARNLIVASYQTGVRKL